MYDRIIIKRILYRTWKLTWIHLAYDRALQQAADMVTDFRFLKDRNCWNSQATWPSQDGLHAKGYVNYFITSKGLNCSNPIYVTHGDQYERKISWTYKSCVCCIVSHCHCRFLHVTNATSMMTTLICDVIPVLVYSYPCLQEPAACFHGTYTLKMETAASSEMLTIYQTKSHFI